jgi:ABC-type uncharacterized transport system substrate-binding protein
MKMQALAKERLALQPDVILAHTTPVAAAPRRESGTAPIVFVYVSDPIASSASSMASSPAARRPTPAPAPCAGRSSLDGGGR